MQNTSVNTTYTHSNAQQEYRVTVTANDDSLELRLDDQKSG
jgi:hypothetical protein